jgi:hypothetical protein
MCVCLCEVTSVGVRRLGKDRVGVDVPISGFVDRHKGLARITAQDSSKRAARDDTVDWHLHQRVGNKEANTNAVWGFFKSYFSTFDESFC